MLELMARIEQLSSNPKHSGRRELLEDVTGGGREGGGEGWRAYLAANRCGSKARGSVYDTVAGICCHFCRQVRLRGAHTAAHRQHDFRPGHGNSSGVCGAVNDCASLPDEAVYLAALDTRMLCCGEQKKLCGEPDCPRCEARDQGKQCIGMPASPTFYR